MPDEPILPPPPPPDTLPEVPPAADDPVARALAVQAKYQPWLLTLPHVVGLGVGLVRHEDMEHDAVGLIVMCDAGGPPAVQSAIPRWLDGVPVDVQPLGPFSAFSAGGS